jgi:hypothetical protein
MSSTKQILRQLCAIKMTRTGSTPFLDRSVQLSWSFNIIELNASPLGGWRRQLVCLTFEKDTVMWFFRETLNASEAGDNNATESDRYTDRTYGLNVGNVLSKLLIEKGVITDEEFKQKLGEERATYQAILKAIEHWQSWTSGKSSSGIHWPSSGYS